MTEVGKISVKAELNTQDFDRGSEKVKSKLDEVKSKSKSAENDFSRMSKGLGTLGGKLLAMGSAGLMGIGALASSSPALAGAMTRIKLATDQLIRSLGEDLAPTFEWLARKYQTFVSFMDEHPLFSKAVVGTLAVVGAIGAIMLLGVWVGKVFTAVKMVGTAFAILNAWKATALLGVIGTIGLAFAGIGLIIAGWKMPDWITKFTDYIGLTDPTDPSMSQDIIRGVTKIGATTATFAAGGAALGTIIPGVGTAVGAGIGGAFGFGKGLYETLMTNAQIERDYGDGNNNKVLNDSSNTNTTNNITNNNQSGMYNPDAIARKDWELNNTNFGG
jgi:hypothetical protein